MVTFKQKSIIKTEIIIFLIENYIIYLKMEFSCSLQYKLMTYVNILIQKSLNKLLKIEIEFFKVKLCIFRKNK